MVDLLAGEDAAAADANGVHVAPDAVAAPFSAEAWLRERGVTTWPHDASCWSKSTGMVPPWTNLCECRKGIVVDGPRPLAVMVCERFVDNTGDRLTPMSRTVLYAAPGGVLRVALDVATSINIDGEAFGLYGGPGGPPPTAPVGRVSLALTTEEGALVVADAPDSGQPCAAALAAADRQKLADVRRGYGVVCASIGRYRWNGERLARQPAK